MESIPDGPCGFLPTHSEANLLPYLGSRAAIYRYEAAMSPTNDDAHLLTAWQQCHDAEAFRVLCERHAGLIEAVCRRQGSPDVAEAVQAVFLTLARRAGSVSGTCLGGWLTTTAQRVVIDQHRRLASRRRHEQEAAMEQARQRAADDADPSWDAARRHLDAALASLSAGRREAILRCYLAGRPQAEVAAELGCSVAAVKMRVHEGLEGLRTFFARKGIALGGVALASGLASEATASEPALVATCVQTVLDPSTAPAASALAHGVITAMIIKTATLIAAGLVLAGSCLTAALVMGSEPAPAPAAVPLASAFSPIHQPRSLIMSPPTPVPAVPAVAKPAWATDSGKDQYGAWSDLQVAGVTQRFRWIQPGTFTMGSPQAEKDAFVAIQPGNKDWVAKEVPHHVTLTQGFWLADSTCTQALWQAITGSNPATFTESPQNPVEQVSWDDCQQFLSKLNGRVSGGGFCLPSEAQWEYACRAGTTTAFSFGSTITPEQVNYNGDYPFAGAAKGLFRQKTVPVKSLPPNAWGLYEMHGNVWQWCNDWHGEYSGNAMRDPAGPSSGSIRVIRGGCWGYGAGGCRSAVRGGGALDDRDSSFGFRIAVQATPTSSQAQPVKDF
jgi:sulfatase modifying factor 1